jgi:hypothetical protein
MVDEQEIEVQDFTEADEDAAFMEGLGEAPEEAPTADTVETTSDSETTSETIEPEEGTAPVEGGLEPEAKADGEDKGESAPDDKPSRESLEKALTDNKQWNSKLSDDNAALRKKVEALEASQAVVKEPEVPTEVKELFEDNPGLKVLFDQQNEKINSLNSELVKGRETQEGFSQQAAFERSISNGYMDEGGNYVEGHADWHKVVTSKEYNDFHSQKVALNPTLNGPILANVQIALLTEFKALQASKAAAAHDDTGKQQAQDMKDYASGSIKPGSAMQGKDKIKKSTEQENEDAFNEGAGIKK